MKKERQATVDAVVEKNMLLMMQLELTQFIDENFSRLSVFDTWRMTPTCCKQGVMVEVIEFAGRDEDDFEDFAETTQDWLSSLNRLNQCKSPESAWRIKQARELLRIRDVAGARATIYQTIILERFPATICEDKPGEQWEWSHPSVHVKERSATQNKYTVTLHGVRICRA